MSEVIVTNVNFAQALSSAERDENGVLIFMDTRAKQQFTILSGTEMYAYNRKVDALPAVGDTFDGHEVTAVYDESDFVNAPKTNSSILTSYTTVDGMVCPTSLYQMFYNCSKLTDLNISKLNTSNVTNMGYMFYGCSKLTNLDVSRFDTTKVTSMSYMFYNCSSLNNIDISNFVISTKNNMLCMFSNSGITSINLENQDLIRASNLSSMFSNCKSLKSVKLASGLSVYSPCITNLSSMFSYCSSLTEITNIRRLFVKTVTNTSYMFANCMALQSLDLSDSSGGTSTSTAANYTKKNITNMNYMFANCSKLSLDCSNWDVSTSASHTGFNNNASGVTIPSKFSSSSGGTGTTLSGTAFAVYCSSDNSLTFSRATSVPTVGSTFNNKTVTNVFTGFETAKYTKGKVPWFNLFNQIKKVVFAGRIQPISTAWWFCYFQSATSFNFGNYLDTSKTVDMTGMFASCNRITAIDLSGLTSTALVTNMSQMFSDCSSLAAIRLSTTWNTARVTDMSNMFNSCSKLSLNCSSWNVSKVTSYTGFNTSAAGVTAPTWGSSGSGTGTGSGISTTH